MKLSNLPNKVIYTVVACWLLATTLAFYLLIKESLSEFDPHFKLANQSLSSQFDKTVSDTVLNISPNSNATVLHIVDKSCACNGAISEHIDEINLWAKQHKFNVKTLDANLVTGLVPASPALIVLGEQGQLIYLGPYSTGYLCSAKEGIALSAINSYIKLQSPSAFIVTDAKGCYCQNS